MTTAIARPTTRPLARPAKQAAVAAPGVRVLHVINGEHYAGAERVQDLLAEHLGAEGFQVGLVCLKHGQFAAVRKYRNAPLYQVTMRGRFDLRAVARLVRIIRREGYQLLHSHSPRSALVAGLAAKIAGIPLVHHVHSPTGRDTTHGLRCRINALVERFVLRGAKALVTVSESLAGYVRGRGQPAEKVNVVPNGVPARKLAPAHAAGQAAWTFGAVALFRPRKGIEVLLHSLALLRAEGLPVRLRAVGGFETPEYETQIKSLCRELGLEDAVDWVGFTADVDTELAKMDALVLPSLFGEGMPMVVLEAMSAGLPVVATRVEGTPEAIRDGLDGLIAEPNDAGSLAAALARLVRGDVDAASLRQNAVARHAERFSAAAMAAGVAAVYRRVLAA